MPFTDNLLAAIALTPKLDTTSKTLLTPFLEANRSFLDRLGPDAASALFRAVFAGNPAPWSVLVSQMDQTQLLALLDQTASAMDSQIALRMAPVARLQTFTQAATDVALRLLAGTLLGML